MSNDRIEKLYKLFFNNSPTKILISKYQGYWPINPLRKSAKPAIFGEPYKKSDKSGVK